MLFKINRIEIENFRSIQSKITLDVKPGLFCIEGINYTETNSTNGVGKTTLIAALFWCLTGTSLTNETLADEVVNLKVGKNCKVSVYIEFNSNEIKITRTRKDSECGNGLFLELDGQDLSCHKIADTQERINKLVKIPFDLLRNTIIMTSGMESAFSALTPAQRIQTLESIRDYSVWERVRDEANKDIKQYNNQITLNNTRISEITGSVTTYNKLISTHRINLQNLVDGFNEKVLLDNINNNNDRINRLLLEKEAKQLELDKLVGTGNIDTSLLIEKSNKILEEGNKLKQQINDKKLEINRNIQNLEYDKKQTEREINTLNKWFKDDCCPTCGKKLDRTEEEIAKKNDLLTEYTTKLTSLSEQLSINNDLLTDPLFCDDLQKQIEEKRNEYQVVQKELSDIQNVQRNLTNNISSINRDIDNIAIEINSLKKQNDTHKFSIDNYTQKLENYKEEITKYSNEIELLSNETKVLEDENKVLIESRSISDFFYKLLGAKGELRPYLLSKDIAYLNTRMQSYIGRFFKNTEVSLLLNNASIDIKIYSDGITKNISSLSGGEKKRVDISIQLALYDLIQTVSQVRFNLLCLDEIESQLDPIGCEQLIEVIEDKSENIETVWWITNNLTVKENIPNKIIVKKVLGKTEIVEE